MTRPIILPTTRPLLHAHRVEFGAWCADKLREARVLGPTMFEAEEIELLLLKARLR